MPNILDEPKCSERRCKHLIGVYQSDGTEKTEIIICKAFPKGSKGIPADIAYGHNLHLQKHPKQDNDILFEKENNEN